MAFWIWKEIWGDARPASQASQPASQVSHTSQPGSKSEEFLRELVNRIVEGVLPGSGKKDLGRRSQAAKEQPAPGQKEREGNLDAEIHIQAIIPPPAVATGEDQPIPAAQTDLEDRTQAELEGPRNVRTGDTMVTMPIISVPIRVEMSRVAIPTSRDAHGNHTRGQRVNTI